MYFAQESIDRLYDDLAGLSAKRLAAVEALLTRPYQVPRAKEFAAHGVSRRLRTMELCIKSVFDILPPEQEEEPSMDDLIDAVVYIQAFTFNAFACVDNLAWIWVCEQKLTTDRGETFPATKIGFSKKCRALRRSLPTDFREHLVSLNAWFDQLENFRHALAHRIPLYIPPSAILKNDVTKYEILEKQIARAVRRGRHDKAKKLAAEQKALTRYQPEMMHSPDDKSKRVVFHPQLLSDFGVICDLASRLLTALASEPNVPIERRFWRFVFKTQEACVRAYRSILATIGPFV